jgi:triosephosphate isomerase
MRRKTLIRGPLFELGLKGYQYGQEAVQLARAASRISRRYHVTIIFTPQCVDISPVARAAANLLVFAPHLDPLRVGRGSGSILPEAVKAAGAKGALLNHCEKPVTLHNLALTVQRAKEVGLLTIVCVDSPAEAAAVTRLGPNMVLAEPSDLIGGSKAVTDGKPDFIVQTIKAVREIDPSILILNSAGIRTPEDAAAVIRAGADGTGATSGVLCSPDPAVTLEKMVMAVREAWEETHPVKMQRPKARKLRAS